MQNYPSVEQLAQMVHLLSEARIANWLAVGLGSWRWWVLLLLLIIPWFIWAKVVNRKILLELSLFGMMIMVISITLDELGFDLSLWSYPVDILPFFPRLSAVDYTVMPISFMLLYQYCSNWKNFFWSLVTLSGIFSFVVEPIIEYLGFYVLIKWMYYYSFIIHIIMGLLTRYLIKYFVAITEKHNIT